MLVLTRKPGEQLVIGGEVCVTVLEVRSGHIRLGFEAPPQVSIRRAELRRQPRRALVAAAEPAIKAG